MPFLDWREVQSPTQGGQGAPVDGGRAAHVRGGQGAQVQGGQGTQVQRRQGAQRQVSDYNNVYGPKDYLDDIRSALAVYQEMMAKKDNKVEHETQREKMKPKSGKFKEEPKAKNSKRNQKQKTLRTPFGNDALRQSVISKGTPEGDRKKWVQYIENQKQVLNEHQHFLDELSDFLLKIN